jgi:hypothetical protein
MLIFQAKTFLPYFRRQSVYYFLPSIFEPALLLFGTLSPKWHHSKTSISPTWYLGDPLMQLSIFNPTLKQLQNHKNQPSYKLRGCFWGAELQQSRFERKESNTTPESFRAMLCTNSERVDMKCELRPGQPKKCSTLTKIPAKLHRARHAKCWNKRPDSHLQAPNPAISWPSSE